VTSSIERASSSADFAFGLFRLAGVAVVVFLATSGAWMEELPARLMAVSVLTFAWLLATGTFGLATVRRDDWLLAPILALALIVRLTLVRPGNSEITLYFPVAGFDGGWFADKHSMVYDAWKAAFVSLWGSSHAEFAVLNGVVGALAVVPLYLFVRHRFDDRLAAALAAVLFSVHPLIARYAPTDAHYSLILLFLFCGLAFLADGRDWQQVFAGLVCLGIAGGLRMEAGAYAAVSLLLVRWRVILSRLRSESSVRAAALAGSLLAIALTIGNFATKRSSWGPEVTQHADWGAPITALLGGPYQRWFVGPLFDSAQAGDGLLVMLFWVGVLASVVAYRFRVGLLAVVAAVVLSTVVLHADVVTWPAVARRFNVVWALQCVVGGVGIAWLLEFLPARRSQHAAAAALACGIAAIIPAWHLAELRREYAFNTEYDLVRNYVEARRDSAPCTLFYFNDGDLGLNNPADVVLGVEARNCAEQDCMPHVREGKCRYLLKGIGCALRGTAPELRQGRALKDLCDEFLAAVRTRPLAERSVDFVEAYGAPAPAGKFPPSGQIGIYEVLGAR